MDVTLRIPEAGVALLSVEEVADLLHISEATLHHWASEGDGPPFYGWAKTPFYRRSEVSSWLKRRMTGDLEDRPVADALTEDLSERGR